MATKKEQACIGKRFRINGTEIYGRVDSILDEKDEHGGTMVRLIAEPDDAPFDRALAALEKAPRADEAPEADAAPEPDAA